MKNSNFCAKVVFVCLLVISAASCNEKNNFEEEIEEHAMTGVLKSTDHMSDGFDSNWTMEEDGGNWWLQTSTGINWAIIKNSNPSIKGRVEAFRPWITYNGSDITKVIEGKFKMETTVDGYPNEGGWVMQTMAWNFVNPAGIREYKPLVVARILPNKVDYLVYDYVWDAGAQKFIVKPGYPLSHVLEYGTQAGKTHTITLRIKFNRGQWGFVQAWLDGNRVYSADYSGPTYPPALPYNNIPIYWKAGCYSSYPGTHYAKIGVEYLYTDVD